MSIKAVFGAAFRSLRREPVRSGLTCLGIIVGVAAVVVTAGIGAGARVRIQEAFERPETRTILLSAVSPPKKGRVARSTVPPGQGLQVEDYVAIRAIEGISASSPRIYRFATQAHATGRASDVLLEGLDVEGFGIFSHRLLRGALFNPFDVKNANNVTVISESLARLLYPGREALGQPLLIDGSAFSVLGIVDDLPDSASSLFGATDLHAYVPFTSLLRRIDGKAQMFIAVQANTVEEVEQVQLRISDVMEERRHGRKSMFVTRNSFDSIKSYADGSLTVARLLAAVGAVALIVGGIGIMNIMLVSVTERTREIAGLGDSPGRCPQAVSGGSTGAECNGRPGWTNGRRGRH